MKFKILKAINDEKTIRDICFLKNQKWKYSLKDQIVWFKSFIKPEDIHILMRYDQKLIGYVVLRKRDCIINCYTETLHQKYIYFDSYIIEKNFRKKKYGKILLNKSLAIIKKNKLFSLLTCKRQMLNFYMKNGWILNNKIKILDHLDVHYKLTYNLNFKYSIKAYIHSNE